jgi:hypothetical protein
MADESPEGWESIRVFCAPLLDTEKCLEISGHVEIDRPSGESSKMGEISPTFLSVSEVVEWARLQADEIFVRIGTTWYWEGPREMPGYAIPLDIDEAEREFQVVLRNPWSPSQA